MNQRLAKTNWNPMNATFEIAIAMDIRSLGVPMKPSGKTSVTEASGRSATGTLISAIHTRGARTAVLTTPRVRQMVQTVLAQRSSSVLQYRALLTAGEFLRKRGFEVVRQRC